MRPGRSLLLVQPQEIGSDLIRLENPVCGKKFVRIAAIGSCEYTVDCSINNNMRDVDALGTQFTRRALGNRA